MEQIYGKERRSEVFTAIDEAPPQLSNMIRHVFKRLALDEDIGKEALNTILLYVTLAKRPLTLGEMDILLRVPDKDPYPLATRLKGRFASLFKLSQSDAIGLDDLDAPTGIVDEEAQCATNVSFSDDLLEQLDFGSDQEGDDNKDIDDQEISDGKEHKNEVTNKDYVDEQTSDPFATTQIEFSHLSIKEFLLQEASTETRQWPDDLGIGLDENAHQKIAMTCLQILCGGITQEYCVHLIKYAMLNFTQHLQSIKQTIPAKDKIEVAKYLVRLLTDENAIQTLLQTLCGYGYSSKNNFIQVWLTDPSFSQSIQNWLAEVDANDDLTFSPIQRSWLQKALKSSKELFRTIASVAANIWLSNTNEFDIWNGTIVQHETDYLMILILYNYSRLVGLSLAHCTAQAVMGHSPYGWLLVFMY